MPIIGTEIVASSYRYTTEDEVRTFLDSLNFTVHTDADRDEDSDPTAVEQGIRGAEARVDLHTGGPYTFAAGTAGDVAAETFNRWAYVLAAYQYAAKRGFSGNQENEFIRNRDEVLLEMQQFRDGMLSLPGAEGPDGETETEAGTFQTVPMIFEPVASTDEDSA